jgi:hypothetical protein
MASVDRDTLNGIAAMTDVHAGGQSYQVPFNGEFVFGVDAFPVFAMQSAMRGQDIDGAYGRALNAGRGVVGEGGDAGPGVVGIAGDAIANPNKPFARELWKPPFPGRGWRFGVIGFGADPVDRGGRADAVGVLGFANKSVGVLGVAGGAPSFDQTKGVGVYGVSAVDSTGCGVLGECNASLGSGVCGTSTSGVGVKGVSSNNDGVAGRSEAEGRSGVFGHNTRTNGSGNGVYGSSDSPDGTGVWGEGVQGNGVVGKTQGLDRCGVYGENTAVLEQPTPEPGRDHLIELAPQTWRGIGVQGVSTHGVGVNGASSNNHGVVGEASRARSGVYGLNLHSSDPHGLDQAERTSYGVTGHADDFYGIGVRGMSKHGYGATLQGGQAPLRLLPAETAGAPASGAHQVGELFVDSHGNLFFCKVTGVPGTWFKIALEQLPHG